MDIVQREQLRVDLMDELREFIEEVSDAAYTRGIHIGQESAAF
jgi:hypothetical protein